MGQAPASPMNNCPTRASFHSNSTPFRLCWWVCVLALFTLKAPGQTSSLWPDQKDLTPEGLVHFFADFTFELGDQVQDGKTFVQRKRGDCDDFAKLVSEILGRHGYTTKLVVVMMPRQTHVVCYVKERHGYLDYNLRSSSQPIVSSDESLEDIADKVAASFRTPWSMASEIRYEGINPVYIFSTFAPAKAKSASPPVPTKTSASASDVRPVIVAAREGVEKPADSKTSATVVKSQN